MKKSLLIGMGATSLVVASSTIILPIVIKNSSENKQNNSIINSNRKIKFKANLKSSDFGFANRKASEVKKLITKSWLVENKDKLFDVNNYLFSESDINNNEDEPIAVVDGDNLILNINGTNGVILDFFPEKSELFDSVVTFPLLKNQTINTHDFNELSLINATADFLFIHHKTIFENNPIKDFLQKAKNNGFILYWDFDLDNTNDEINERNKTILEKAFWGKPWEELALNNKDIKDAKKIQIQYQISKWNESYLLSPYKYVITLANEVKELEVPSLEKNKYSYEIKFRVRTDKPVGTVLTYPADSMLVIPIQANRRIEAKEFGVNEVQSLLDVGKSFSTIDFIWNNKASLFSNHYDIEYKELITNVDYNTQYATNSIKVVVSWKGRTETSDIIIFVDEDAQAKFRGLSSIRNWNSRVLRGIESSKLSMKDVRNKVIEDIYNDQRQTFGSDIELKEMFNLGVNDDEFSVNLHSSYPYDDWKYEFNWKGVFKRWWQFEDYNVWKSDQKSKSSMPRIDDISDIQLNFKLTKKEATINGQKGYRMTATPISVSVSYKRGVYPTIKLNFNSTTQEQATTFRDYVVV